jgi:geranylgeranyl reductase family protein
MKACDYDIVIVGAGPAGSTCALYAARSGLNVLLLDKETFPRDKICGDAISGISLRFLQELDLQEEIEKAAGKRGKSMLVFAPDGSSTEISFTPRGRSLEHFNILCRREILDNILFQRAKQEVDTLEGFTVNDILMNNGHVCGIRGLDEKGREKELRANVIIGADGCRSVIARKAGLYHLDPKHQVIATRAYYEGVSDMKDAIEIHFVNKVIPGYFWIFPLRDNRVNVGLGMVHREIMKRRINIREAHIEATRSPRLCDRFQNATMHGPIRGWNLPLAHKNRKMVGDGVLLIGDAAGLVHPLSGEGISFSMLSGYLAAQLIAEVNHEKDFSAATLQHYQTRLWKEVGLEFLGGSLLQKIGAWKPFINSIVHKAHKNSAFNNMISQLLAGDMGPGALVNPMVYLRMFFR